MKMTNPGQAILTGTPTTITPLPGDYMPSTAGIAPGPIDIGVGTVLPMPKEIEPNVAINPSTNNMDPRSGYDQI